MGRVGLQLRGRTRLLALAVQADEGSEGARYVQTTAMEKYKRLVLLCHKLRRERPFVFAPQHGQRDKMATSLAMSRRRKVEIELGT